MNNQEVSTAYVGSTEIKECRLGSQLVLAPNGDALWYKANEVPTLDLRFAENESLVDATTGANLVDFTRASPATYVDSQGVIRNAVTNLLLRSEEFDNAAWGKFASTVSANATTSPSGTTTADKLIEDTGTSEHQINGFPSLTSGTSYTVSMYVKAAERTFVRFGFAGTGFAAPTRNTFNLSTGTIAINAGGNPVITPVGNGWYRLSVTNTATSTTTGLVILQPALDASTISYTGDGTSGIYVWGAQLERSSTVGEYVPTTSTINSAPRFDHNPTTGESLGLLVEESRTNLLTYSEDFTTTFWGLAAATRTPNVGTAPDGALTADRIESTGGGVFRGGVSVSNATAYTYSVFLKHASGTGVVSNVGFERFGTTTLGGQSSFNLITGTVVNNGPAVTSSSIVSYGNGWYRVSVTVTSTDVTTTVINYASASGNQFLIWGAQLEAGSFPTSYIPTTSATVTRAADVASITGANFSSWYNQSEGTVFAECNVFGDNKFNQFIYSISDGALGDEIRLFKPSGNNSITSALEDSVGGTTSNIFGNTDTPFGSPWKTAHAFAANYAIRAVNGINSSADTTVTVPVVNQMRIGARMNETFYANLHLSRLTYWPQRLSDATLQTITL